MKKHISLKDAHYILENCAAVIWGDSFLSYPSVPDLAANGNNEFLFLKCEDEEGQIFTASFTQNENERVQVSGSSMFLTDDKGEEIQITILWSDDNTFEKCENIGPQIFE
jgi:hypothetical protein